MTDRITVTGNIGQAPMLKATPKGDVVEFTLARSQRVQAEDGGWRDGETLWYAVSAWDRLGASAEAALRRGQRVIVEGRLTERRWTGQDGVERLSRDLRADVIGRDISQRADVAAGAERPDWPGPPGEQRPAGADRGARAASEPLRPAPAGWSTTLAVEEEDAPF